MHVSSVSPHLACLSVSWDIDGTPAGTLSRSSPHRRQTPNQHSRFAQVDRSQLVTASVWSVCGRVPGRSALTLAPPLSTTNIVGLAQSAPPATSSPHAFHPDVTCDFLCPAWAERADRRPSRCTVAGAPAPTSPVAGPQRPATQGWRSPSPSSNHRAASGSLLPDSFSQPNIPMASPHSPNPLPPHLRNRPICLVHLKIAREVPRLLEFAILVWTIPAPVVQIHIAIPATDASGRVERLHHSANSLKRGRRLSF